MSVHGRRPRPVPAVTVAAARRAFRRGNPYLALRDALGVLITDADLLDLYDDQGRPAIAPGTLALVTLLQFAEGLSDRAAAEAVRSRIDWKYLLGLALDDDGFDASVLVDFRDRLIAGSAESRLLDLLLARAQAHGVLTAGGRQRTDATHVLAAVRTLNRLELVTETMRAALNVLATVAPDWLLMQRDVEWVARYEQPWGGARQPKGEQARRARAEEVGGDGQVLLQAIATAPAAWQWLGQVPAIQTLAMVWSQQYQITSRGVRWKPKAELPPATLRIGSPDDRDARVGEKRGRGWLGYKVHLTESCDAQHPHLITQVTTTPACVNDVAVTHAIQQDLVNRGLRPGLHLADAGYSDADILVSSAAAGITFLAPTVPDRSPQAQAHAGYAAADFVIDWEAKRATCPQGKQSVRWQPTIRRESTEVIQIHFRTSDCQRCPVRSQCTTADRRSLTIRPQAQYEARIAALAYQATPAFWQAYAARAGIEGTLSEAVHEQDMRRSRYRRHPKVALEHQLIGAALTVRRLGAWFLDPHHARTRRPRFAVLLAPTRQ